MTKMIKEEKTFNGKLLLKSLKFYKDSFKKLKNLKKMILNLENNSQIHIVANF